MFDHLEQVRNLEPKIVFSIFAELTQIPRPSKKEEKIRSWVKKWAAKHQINWIEDEIGNILLKKPASLGNENKPVLVLQGHLDIVCVKDNNVVIDFENDPIPVRTDGKKIISDGTSLGADNGIGVAMALATLIEPGLEHGPLEVLLTVDEETGMTGAFALESGFFTGKLLINLDSEEWGTITIGSAGGGDSIISLIINPQPIDDKKYSVKVIEISGLRGGHSGMEINKPRINAIKCITRFLLSLSCPFQVCNISGGIKRNAIPSEAQAVVAFPSDRLSVFKANLDSFQTLINKEAGDYEPNLVISVKDVSSDSVLTIEDTRIILELLQALPHGVIAYSSQIPGLVETSTNLAQVEIEKGKLTIIFSTRSSVSSKLKDTKRTIEAVGRLANATVQHTTTYPGWKPDINSPFLKYVKEQYRKFLDPKELKIDSIHAGLETGILGRYDEDLQMVSFGPDIRDVHSPSEMLDIESVYKLWDVLKSIISNLNSNVLHS